MPAAATLAAEMAVVIERTLARPRSLASSEGRAAPRFELYTVDMAGEAMRPW
jgi:hypothetical protein